MGEAKRELDFGVRAQEIYSHQMYRSSYTCSRLIFFHLYCAYNQNNSEIWTNFLLAFNLAQV